MLMLSISTSGPTASAALIKDGEPISCAAGRAGLTHSETIMPLCEKLLGGAGFGPGDISALAVDIGPGSFTGVRIGVCAANAMGAALCRPIVGVSSLEALIGENKNACALLDCRNGNGYAMVRSGGLNMPPSAVIISELMEKLPENILLMGSGAVTHREALLLSLPLARFAEDNEITAKAVGIAAWKKLMAGEAQKEAVPLYLRPSQAERLAGTERR